jgi:hypothetical protein
MYWQGYQVSHSHAIWLHWHCLTSLGRCRGKRVTEVIEAYIEGSSRTPPVHCIAGTCVPPHRFRQGGNNLERNVPTTVSTSATRANRTTPNAIRKSLNPNHLHKYPSGLPRRRIRVCVHHSTQGLSKRLLSPTSWHFTEDDHDCGIKQALGLDSKAPSLALILSGASSKGIHWQHSS